MENNPNSHRKIRLAGLVGLPIGGVILGVGGMCLWLHAQTPDPGELLPERVAQLEPGPRFAEPAKPIEPLYAIPAQSLYLDNFQAPSMARETWEQAEKFIYARVPAPRKADGEKPLLASLASAINPVQEAHAETQPVKAAPGGQVAGQAKKTEPNAPAAAAPAKPAAVPAQVKPDLSAQAPAKPNAPAASHNKSDASASAQKKPDAPASSHGKSDAPASAQNKSDASAPVKAAVPVAVLSPKAAPEKEQTPAARSASVAQSATTAQKAPTQSMSKDTPKDNLKDEPKAAPEETAFPAAFPAGSLGQLTQLRAELEQLKLQVTIEEARSRLNQLRGLANPAPAAPMPTLEYPPIGMPEAPKRDKSLRILSIQSVNGKFTATVGTASGPRVVKQNDTINGNRVVSISRNSVVINRGQGNETLSIQD